MRSPAVLTVKVEAANGPDVRDAESGAPVMIGGDHEYYMTRTPTAAQLTRIELAMIRVIESFARWVVELHKVGCGGDQLSYEDIAVLHCVRMRGPTPSLSEVLLFLNRHDVANLQYSLRKLVQHGLVESHRGTSRRESRFSLTALGIRLTNAYASLREETLVNLCEEVPDSAAALEKASGALEHLVGVYDHATQTVLNRRILGASDRRRR